MHRWPAVDRDLRRALLDEVRRRHNVEASQRSPADRLARLAELIALARAFEGQHSQVDRASASDEPLDLWRRMKARFREADERR